MTETEMILKGYGLTTAEFVYGLPDHPAVLNTFTWQWWDLMPDHPRLFEFIEFWQREIEGPLKAVRFVHRRELGPPRLRHVTGEFTLH